MREFEKKLQLYKKGIISDKRLIENLQGWFGYVQWADAYSFRKEIVKKFEKVLMEKNSNKIEQLYKIAKL